MCHLLQRSDLLLTHSRSIDAQGLFKTWALSQRCLCVRKFTHHVHKKICKAQVSSVLVHNDAARRLALIIKHLFSISELNTWHQCNLITSAEKHDNWKKAKLMVYVHFKGGMLWADWPPPPPSPAAPPPWPLLLPAVSVTTKSIMLSVDRPIWENQESAINVVKQWHKLQKSNFFHSLYQVIWIEQVFK